MLAGEFRLKGLAVMDQVMPSGEPLLITKHGKPVASSCPLRWRQTTFSATWPERAKIAGNIVCPITPLEDWENK
jgi:antitoxin (DNA-binding transcriptional repressor) of toxin-antitoxin stability system